MKNQRSTTATRRDFLASIAAGATAMAASSRWTGAAPSQGQLLAGEGVVDITPPLGIEMGGFHRPPGKERRILGIRQPCAARALLLEMGGVRVAICSLDVAGVGHDMAARTFPDPLPGRGEVIVATAAAGVNPFDFKTAGRCLQADFSREDAAHPGQRFVGHGCGGRLRRSALQGRRRSLCCHARIEAARLRNWLPLTKPTLP